MPALAFKTRARPLVFALDDYVVVMSVPRWPIGPRAAPVYLVLGLDSAPSRTAVGRTGHWCAG